MDNEIARQRIKARLDELKFSPNFVSRKAGLDRTTLGNFLSGRVEELRDSNLRAIAKVLKLDPSYIRGETVSPTDLRTHAVPLASLSNTIDVPIVGVVEAGAFRPVDWYDDVDLGVIVNGYDPSFPTVRQFGFSVRGDSMDLAGINDGDDVVCIDPWEAGIEIASGNYVVVENRMDGGHTRELTVKELLIHEDRYELIPRSSNPKHKPLRVPRSEDLSEDREVRVVGIVTSIVRRLRLIQSARPTSR